MRLDTKRPTKQQRLCVHPPAHTHPTYDPRWEICDLCHLVRPRTEAPWIVAHDAALPPAPPPPLFAGHGHGDAPQEPAPTKKAEQTALDRETCPRCAGKRRVTVTPVFPNNAPDVSITCPRCRGTGKVAAYHLVAAFRVTPPSSSSRRISA